MKIQDEDLKKVSGGRAPEYGEANFGKEIPSNSLSNHIFNMIYAVDKTNNKNWILGTMMGKWHNAPKFDITVEVESTGGVLEHRDLSTPPELTRRTLPIDSYKFYEYH